MRTFLRALLVASVVASAVSLVLSTTAFGASYKPDARIRLLKEVYPHCGQNVYDNPWIGDNVYNTTANRQKDEESVYAGGDCFTVFYFQISIQNGGAHADRFTIKAPGGSSTDWPLKYFHGSTNISSAVINGTFKTANVAPGGEYLIVATVKYTGVWPDGFSRLLTVSSVGGGAKDAVRFSIKPYS